MKIVRVLSVALLAVAVTAALVPEAWAGPRGFHGGSRGGFHGGARGYHGGYHGHRGHRGAGAAGLIGGLVAGAIVGGIVASQAAANNRHAACAQRYRSYDPGSGTYVGRNGVRYVCQ